MTRSLAFLALMLSVPSIWAADAGRVLLAAGNAVVIRANQTIPLTRDSAIQEKDVLRTGPGSSLQVRFSDESLVSMRENSELSVDNYRFEGRENGNEMLVFRLVKGGLRTITGLIGKTNHKNYSLSSVTSTIGIRGTDYAATLCQGDCRNADGSAAADGLYGRVIGQSSGTNRIVVSNESHERQFGINQNFYVADARSEPRQLLEAPSFVSSRPEGRGQTARKDGDRSTGRETATSGGASQESRVSSTETAAPEPLAYVVTEDKSASGNPTVLTGTLGIAGANGGDAGGATVFASQLTLSGTTLIGLNVTGTEDNGTPFSFSGTTTIGAVADTGSSADIYANWGRWTSGTIVDNGVVITLGPAPNGHFHYIYGELTPPDVVASKTGTAVFSRIGGTTPTDSVSPVNTASSFTFGSIGINFTTRTASLSSLNMSFPTGVNYNFSSVPLTMNFSGGAASIEGRVTNSTGCTGGACITSSPATLKIDGAFLGPNGNHIGAVFATQSVAGTTASAQLFKCSACP